MEINERTKIIIIGIMLLVACVLAFFSWKSFSFWLKNKDSKDAILQEIETIKSRETSLKSLLPLALKIDTNLAIINTAIPEGVNIPGFMTQIESGALDAGLKVDRLSFVRSDTGSSKTKEKATTPTVSLSGSFSGNYESILKFFKMVEGARRITYSHDIKISAVVDKEMVGNYNLTSVFDGFYLLETTEYVTKKDSADFRTGANAKILEALLNLKEYQIQRIPNSVLELTTPVDIGTT